MLWCQSAQNIGLSNRKLKFALTYTVWSQCTLVPDRRTDEHRDSSATILSTNASRAKDVCICMTSFYKLAAAAAATDKQHLSRLAGLDPNLPCLGPLCYLPLTSGLKRLLIYSEYKTHRYRTCVTDRSRRSSQLGIDCSDSCVFIPVAALKITASVPRWTETLTVT